MAQQPAIEIEGLRKSFKEVEAPERCGAGSTSPRRWSPVRGSDILPCVAWCVGLIAVFGTLAVRRYRTAVLA